VFLVFAGVGGPWPLHKTPQHQGPSRAKHNGQELAATLTTNPAAQSPCPIMARNLDGLLNPTLGPGQRILCTRCGASSHEKETPAATVMGVQVSVICGRL